MEDEVSNDFAQFRMMSSPVSRRKFLQASGALLAAPAVLTAGVTGANAAGETDVIVVGGGAAGCVAAAVARANGAQVMLCEKAGFLGGTSAKSGGVYWIPNNFDMRRRGIADPKDALLRFVTRYSYPAIYDPASATLGLSPDTYALLGAFYDHAAPMIERLSTIGALKSTALLRYTKTGTDYLPDYLEHAPENLAPHGRCLVPLKPDGNGGDGDDLMEQLVAHVQGADIGVRLGCAVIGILQNADHSISGVRVRDDSGDHSIRARRGVIFCSGGYSQNRDLVARFQLNPIFGRCGLPTCTGDFIEQCVSVGGRLGNMTGAWRAQCVFEQTLLYESLPNEVWYPIGDSMFVVNKYGVRCFNEKRNYHDRTRESYHFDANRAEYPNLFNFPIYDLRTAELFGGNFPLPDEPHGEPYVISGATLAELAANLDTRLAQLEPHTGGLRLDADFLPALERTFKQFNGYASAGRDPDFNRGKYPFDGEWHSVQARRSGTSWPAEGGVNPVMYPLATQGPYFTMILAPAVLDTNGGPEIDVNGRVLGVNGQPIKGLYGAGNCIASPAGDTYWGAGATIGSAMTFAFIAAQHASARGEK